MRLRGIGLLGLASLVAMVLTSSAQAQAPVGLGTADSFAVLAGSTVTNTGPSVINGDLGVSPGNAVTGFPPGTVNEGTIHQGDAVAAQAQSDLTVAYNDAAGRACDRTLTGQDLGGMTLTSGVYCFAESAQLTGDLTLNAQGDPDAVFIFQIGSALTTASGSNVNLINAAQACNVFWKVGSSATLGTTTTFVGNILALTSITANTRATVEDGRLLARNGAVTLDTNTITRAECDTGGGDDEGNGGGDGDGEGGGDGDGEGGGDGDGEGDGDDEGDGDGNGDGDGEGDGDGDGDGDDEGNGNGDGDDEGDGDGGALGKTRDGDGGDTAPGGDSGPPTTADAAPTTGGGSSLPFTGLDIHVLALIGIVMLLLGASLRVIHRHPTPRVGDRAITTEPLSNPFSPRSDLL